MRPNSNQQPEWRSLHASSEPRQTQSGETQGLPAVLSRLDMRRRPSLLLVALTVLLATLAACSGQPVYETVSAISLTADDLLEPNGDPILSVAGAFERTVDGNEIRLDLETLDRFGVVEYTIFDPWLKTDVTYSGVLMATILDTLEVASTAEIVGLSALDDYRVEIPVDDIREWPILLATRRDGQPLRISDGGPSRVIYPVHAFRDAANAEYRANWIWNVARVEIR